MIIYNVTMNVEKGIDSEFITWLKKTHIPEVLQTGLFVKYVFLKLLSEDPEAAGPTYAVQYYIKNLDDFVNYTENYAPALQAKVQKKFGEKVLAFRTLLELMDESK